MKITEPNLLHFQGEICVPAGREFTFEYIQLPFEVPEMVNEIRLQLRYSPISVEGITNLITLGLFDPRGFRGNAHRSPPDAWVRVATDSATAGFIPGPLPAGTWLAQLAVHAVLADTRACSYSLDIEMRTGNSSPAAPSSWQPPQRVLRDQAGWYRGELHSHTVHSDADWTASELIAAAQKRGLDFLFITDHNTHSVYYEQAGKNPDGLLLIPGIELTTFEGHALVLGIQSWVDWRSGYQGWRMQDAADEIHRQQGLFVVAHPHAPGSPCCTGCRWDYADFDLANADGLEVWNGTWGSEGDKNPEGLRMWHELLKQGARITATAGTDIHTARDWDADAPFVYIHARSLSAEALIAGIRAGSVILSSGPWMDLHVRAKGSAEVKGVGETCKGTSQSFTLSAEWDSVPQYARMVIRNRQGVVEVLEVSGKGVVTCEATVERSDSFWVELYARDGALLALTNPIEVQFAVSVEPIN